jgi:hypothetical protein
MRLSAAPLPLAGGSRTLREDGENVDGGRRTNGGREKHMTRCPSLLPLGGCTLTIPLKQLHRRKIVSSILPDIGFMRWPLVLSAGSALQMVDIVRGITPVPSPTLASLCYHDATLPSTLPAGAAERLTGADVCLMQISTPVEIEYDGYFLNRNRLHIFVFELAEAAGDRKLAAHWLNALTKGSDALREKHASALINLLEGNDLACDIVARTRSHIANEDEIFSCLAGIRAVLRGAMGLVLYNFRYMPDGRPLDWPLGFKDQMKSVAARLGIAICDPAYLVVKHGVEAATVDHLGHYTPAFNDVISLEYEKFLRTLVDVPALSST